MSHRITKVIATIDYIETHLAEKIDLDAVANAVHYSKYHLHRIFTDTVGLTIHDYIQRRQLTIAAKLLVCSNKSILEIALSAGYASQQSFTAIFKAMYKKSPHQFRTDAEFYPLQLRYALKESLDCPQNIRFATFSDIPAWMYLVNLVVDGFPHLHAEQYLAQLQQAIAEKRTLIMKNNDTAIIIMIFNRDTGRIDFWGLHPQYRKRARAKAFLRQVVNDYLRDTDIRITTFREGDKADLGYRKLYQDLGFSAAELLIEFGYPTQAFVLPKHALKEHDHA